MASTPKRKSYSIYRVPSALDGHYRHLCDRLHVELLVLVETTPGVGDYELYTPTIQYSATGREREWTFPIAVNFVDGHGELWASTWERTPDAKGPLETARRTHAKSMGRAYRLFTEADFYGNPVAYNNRRQLRAFLAAWHQVDTQTAEERVLMALKPGRRAKLGDLEHGDAQSAAGIRLAVYRLLMRGSLIADLGTGPISRAWTVERPRHA